VQNLDVEIRNLIIPQGYVARATAELGWESYDSPDGMIRVTRRPSGWRISGIGRGRRLTPIRSAHDIARWQEQAS
jgi:hypothetical protein